MPQSKHKLVDYLFDDLSKLFRDRSLKATINSVVDEKILSNDSVDSLLIDSKIAANNTTQQSTVDGKITANNSSLTTSITNSVNAGIPAQVASSIANTPLSGLSDTQDYTAASIPNAYNLSWNSSTMQWEPTAGAAAKGNIRLFVAEKASNANVFYFNAITVTALASASPNIDTAFMVTSNLLNTLTIDLRSNQNISNSVRVDLYKNGNGAAFSSATTSIANQTHTLTQYTVVRYTFSGLTLNQYDSIHIKVTPTSNPGELYGIVTIA